MNADEIYETDLSRMLEVLPSACICVYPRLQFAL